MDVLGRLLKTLSQMTRSNLEVSEHLRQNSGINRTRWRIPQRPNETAKLCFRGRYRIIDMCIVFF